MFSPPARFVTSGSAVSRRAGSAVAECRSASAPSGARCWRGPATSTIPSRVDGDRLDAAAHRQDSQPPGHPCWMASAVASTRLAPPRYGPATCRARRTSTRRWPTSPAAGSSSTRRSFPRTPTCSLPRRASTCVSCTSSAILAAPRTRGRARRRSADGAARSHMEQIGPAKSAVLWDVWNLAGGDPVPRRAGSVPAPSLRGLRRRSARQPSAAILAMVGMEDAELPFVNGNEARTTPNHSVAGNPGSPPPRRDHAAQRRSLAHAPWHVANRRLVSALTSPLLLRYGYPLRPAAPKTAAATRPSSTARRPGRAPCRGLARRVRRHLRWGRTEGFSRLVEEDELNPRDPRCALPAAKWNWRRAHPREPPGWPRRSISSACSGRGRTCSPAGLDIAPEFEVHNENDRAVFDHFLLRDDDVVRRVVMASQPRVRPLQAALRLASRRPSARLARHAIARTRDLGVPRRRRPCRGRRSRSSAGTICSHSRDIAAGKGAGDVAGAAAVRRRRSRRSRASTTRR